MQIHFDVYRYVYTIRIIQHHLSKNIYIGATYIKMYNVTWRREIQKKEALYA